MRKILTIFAAASVAALACAQSPQQTAVQQRYEEFRRRLHQRHDEFVDKVNRRYADLMERVWERYNALKPAEKPVIEDPVEEPVYDKDKDKNDTPRNLSIDDVKPLPKPIVPRPVEPQPEPQPVQPAPVAPRPTIQFDYLGVKQTVTAPQIPAYTAPDEKHCAEAWRQISASDNNLAMLSDLKGLRTSLNLCDWAYKLLVDDVVDAVSGDGNSKRLLKAWLMCSSGYAMRLATDGNALYTLFGTEHVIYERPRYQMSGMYFYPDRDISSLSIFDNEYPGEKPLSLIVDRLPKVGSTVAMRNERGAAANPAFKASSLVDAAVLDFYNRYAPSEYGNNFMTRWVMLASAPISDTATGSIVVNFGELLDGKSEFEGISLLLNWVQTGFVYEYDNKVWGHDRAFAPEETIYYPFSDCEDRAILFTKLVREIYHRPVAIMYYPGHLSTAVCFSQKTDGDYIIVDGRRFTICDPTYRGAPVGATMPTMDNSTATVAVLED